MSRVYLLHSTQVQTVHERKASYRTFDAKSKEQQKLINEAIHILDSLGIPVEDKSARKLERMALAFLALCDVKNSEEWSLAKSLDEGYSLRTRDIIDYLNRNFGEK
ncbi:MAG: hypothetical protein O7G87_23440, partial [bacterium]|nr:hypothetical protein [bacterium]